MGLICGVICFLLGKYIYNLSLTITGFGFILLNRTMIGFVIGISVLNKMNWLRHGALIGTIVGTIFAYADAMFGFGWFVIVSILIVNPLFGIFIEYFTTKVFNAPIQ